MKALLLAICLVLAAPASALPPGARPLETRISPEHPLIILYSPGTAEGMVRAWEGLEADIRPYCMYHVEWQYRPGGEDQGLRAILAAAQRRRIPLVFQIAGPDEGVDVPLDVVERLLGEFPTIKGIMMVETSFRYYSGFGGGLEHALGPNTRYTIAAIKLAARHGKFFANQLAYANYAYVMAGELNRPLYDTMRQYRDYVIVQHEMNTPFGWLQAHLAPLGLWLEGAAAQWGVEPQSWYWADSEYAGPEDFTHSDMALMPPAVYRQMILTGVTAGATVYSFEPPNDLPGGDRDRHWREAICPTMRQVLRERLIPSRQQVLAKMKVAYQLAAAATPEAMHRNLRDIDEHLDEGNLIRGTYGLYDHGLEYELVPNTGRYYWIPLLSPYAPAELLAHFRSVIRPGQLATPAAFREHCNRFYQGDGEGTACIMSIGPATYVMQTHENLYERQTYTVSLPAAPVGVTAERAAAGTAVRWQRRPGDRSYTVWRCAAGGEWQAIAGPVTAARYVDPHPPEGAWYAVSAVTSARQAVRGTVNLHDALILSNVASPRSTPAALPGTPPLPPPPEDRRPAAPGLGDRLEQLSPEQRAMAEQVLARLRQWQAAIVGEDLPAALDAYAAGYRDADGYSRESVERSLGWLFQRYDHPWARVIVLGWDFGRWPGEGLVGVRVYAVFHAVSVVEENPDDLIHFPRNRTNGTMLWWQRGTAGQWRLTGTDPALPSLAELLIYST